jgi:hypothetical protein
LSEGSIDRLETSYAGAGQRGTVGLEHYEDDGVMALLITHELGHSFGLQHGLDGVNEEVYTLAEYESVLNHSGLYEVVTYSDGEDVLGREEWGFVADERHQPSVDCPEGSCPVLCGGTPEQGLR